MTSCRVGDMGKVEETDWHRFKVLLFGQFFLEVNVLFLCFVLKMNHLLWFGDINKCAFRVIHSCLQWLWYFCNYVSVYTLEIIFTPGVRTSLFTKYKCLLFITFFADIGILYHVICPGGSPSGPQVFFATHTETVIELIVVWNDIYRHLELDEQIVIWLSKSH